jgi:methylated-DNA-[protein]-cysteine S-methyltransferase
MIVAATARGPAGVWFEGQRHLPDHSNWPHRADHPVLQQAQTQLREYFAGTRSAFDLPLDLQGGTAFQRSVWDALLAIPRGGTTSYGTLSRSIGQPAAVRAVGAAVGRNPLSIVVPCHRVVGADGSLTGYAGGLERKTALLRLEGVA